MRRVGLSRAEELKKMHPDFETRMMWKEYTGLPMNVAIDDGYAYDFHQQPFIIWILARDEDRLRGPRMRIQRNESDVPQVEDAFWMTLADAPETIGLTGSELSAKDLDYLSNFIVRNKAALLAHWNGETASEVVARGLAF